MSSRAHWAEHAVPVAAPAGVVYGLLADAVRWPVLLPSYVHVERVDWDVSGELLHVWDLPEGRVRRRRVRRVLYPEDRTVESQETDPALPGVLTRGTWSVAFVDDGRCVLTLRRQRPTPVGREPQFVAVQEAFEAQVRADLAQIRTVAETWERLDELLLAFEESVRVSGAAELVYDFLYRIEDWADLISHVERTAVTEDLPGVQVADVDSCWIDGGTVTSRAVRLCFPAAGRIVHKEVVLPELLAGHTVEWSLVPDQSGLRVLCAHSVMLREAAVGPVLGPGVTTADARHEVRAWLGRASAHALAQARWRAESALRHVG
jgi:aromatase